MDLSFREAVVEDVDACSEICFAAFSNIAQTHSFPSDFPNAQSAASLIDFMVRHSDFYGVVCEFDGQIVGSNFLDERGEIVGLGPITVSVNGQNCGFGKQLMQHCLDRCETKQARGVRLLQAAYHNRSLALYTRLGFEVQDVVSVLQGPALNTQVEGFTVRSATFDDLSECNALHESAHGHERKLELQDAIQVGSAKLAEQGGAIRGYFSSIGFRGFGVAENNEAMKALLAQATEFSGPGILVPSGNGELMRWCLENGLKVVQQMTIMTKGYFKRPALPYVPSILY